MRRDDVHVGGHYLTRTVHVSVGWALRARATRGEVKVEARVGDTLYVRWLMADGSERTDPGLPKRMKAKQLAAEVKR